MIRYNQCVHLIQRLVHPFERNIVYQLSAKLRILRLLMMFFLCNAYRSNRFFGCSCKVERSEPFEVRFLSRSEFFNWIFFICGWPSSKLSTVFPVFSSLWHVRQNPPQCLVKARRLPFSFSKDVKILNALTSFISRNTCLLSRIKLNWIYILRHKHISQVYNIFSFNNLKRAQ